MFLKRLIPSALAAACVLTLLVSPASAHGGCHGGLRRAQPVRCGVCTVEGCEIAGRHTHRGVACCGYDHEGGVCDGRCAPLCTVEGCELAGRHTHDGVTYCGYDHEAGFCDGTCRALCTVEGCTLTGLHTHNGVACCGYGHEAGFCDGSCAAAAIPACGGCRHRCR